MDVLCCLYDPLSSRLTTYKSQFFFFFEENSDSLL
jgi:hypothetical protein